jgi:hypothetical protein
VSDTDVSNAQLQSRVLAATALAEMSGKLSAKFDRFASWLLAGFGGAIALLLTNQGAGLVPPRTVRACAILFGWAVIVIVVEKYVAIIVSAGSDGAAFSRILILEHMKLKRELAQSPDIDIKTFADEIRRPMIRWPARWLASKQIRKTLSGDHTAGSRPLMYLAQIQGLLTLVEIAIFLAALGNVVANLPRV